MNVVLNRSFVAWMLSLFVIVLAVGTWWSAQNPLPTFWDEADYLTTTTRDYQAIRGPGPIGSRLFEILKADVGEPPAHRAAVAIALVTGPNLLVLRFISLAITIASAALVFAALRRTFGTLPASIAGTIAILSPTVISSGIRYQSEYPLFLATSGLVYFVVSSWNGNDGKRRDGAGLACAIGLGLWSKPSFIAIAGPILVLAYVVSSRQIVPSRPAAWLRRSVLYGIGIGAIYYIPFGFETFKYLQRSSIYNRETVDGSEVHRLWTFVSIFASTALGPETTILAISAICIVLFRLSRTRWRIDRPMLVVMLGIAGSIPVAALQFLGGNFDARLFGPTIYPLSVAIAVALTMAGTERVARVLALESCLILMLQLATMLAPLAQSPDRRFHIFLSDAIAGNNGDGAASSFAPRNEWDWSRLHSLVADRGVRDPSIAYIGNGDPYSIGQIALPWIMRDEDVRVTWLWRLEDGAIDWQHVLTIADRSDVAVVAPTYVGLRADKQPLDNVHNVEFAKRLEADPHFQSPHSLLLGNIEPTQVLVFFNTRAHPAARQAFPTESRTKRL